MARILYWDIESSSLNADFGMVGCIGYAFNEDKPTVITVRKSPTFKKDPTNDAYVVKEFQKVMCLADMQVFHYGRKFDFPFIQTRLLFHGLPLMPRVRFWDGQKVAHDHLKLSRNSLASIQAFLGLPTEKTQIKPQMWLRAISGHVSSLKYIEDHCYKDVEVLRQAYKKMRPLNEAEHPSMQGIMQSRRVCATCGSMRVYRHGTHSNMQGVFAKLKCDDCGRWNTTGEKLSKMPKF